MSNELNPMRKGELSAIDFQSSFIQH